MNKIKLYVYYIVYFGMSFFNINENNISTEEKIKYIYSGVSINHRDITALTNDHSKNSIKKELPEVEGKRIQEKNTFYQIKLRNKEPNFIYGGLSPSSYTAKSIYLFGLLHRNISGISSTDKSNIVGEIVVEHTNTNKQLQKVYTCFLVKEIDSNITEENPKGDTTDNSLDKLVHMMNNELIPEESFDLSSVIPSQTHSIHYVDKTNHIFVFTKPIEINKDTARFFKTNLSIKTNLFSIYPTNANSNKTLFYGSETILLNGTPSNQDGFRLMEGIDQEDDAEETNDIWIDCSPTGESDDTVQALRNIPVDSEYSKHKEQIDGFKMITHFFMFILIVLLAFFMVPKLYKSIVIDRFNIDADAHMNIFHADMATIIIVIVNLVVSFFTSVSIYYIMFLSSISIASYALIQFNKTLPEFMTTDDRIASYASNAKFQPEGKDVSMLGGFSILLMMLYALGENMEDSQMPKLWPYLLFVLVSFFIILSINYALEYQNADQDKKADVKYFNGTIWITPLILSVTVISPIIMLVINNSKTE